MATRSVFIPKPEYPFFEDVSVDLQWFGGFAVQQKRRCYLSLHLNFLADERYAGYKPLEISSASHIPTGVGLSAMSLMKHSEQAGKDIVMESAFQSSRVYVREDGTQIGPFPEYLTLPGKECKKVVKELSEGLHSYSYVFDGMVFPAPAFHISLFYDWLYLNALGEDENAAVRDALITGGYDAFTDIATSALNSQARSCAIFVSLYKLGLLDQVRDQASYFRLFRVDPKSLYHTVSGSWTNVQRLKGSTYLPLHDPVPQTVSADQVKDYYNRMFCMAQG